VFRHFLVDSRTQESFRENDRRAMPWRHALATKIGPTSTQAASGRGKARTVANLGASGSGDG
jgi:hypothetical protein